MIKELNSLPRSDISFEEAVYRSLSGSGIGDLSNNFLGIRFSLAEPELWANASYAKTYEDYVKDKFERRPDIAAAVIARSDRSFVEAYNEAMNQINNAIGEGIKNQEQADEVRRCCDAASKLIREFSLTLRNRSSE